jgi:hypothetical protein
MSTQAKHFLNDELGIAIHACDEQQPMPSDGLNQRCIAEFCEEIGEQYALTKRWRECATAHRMACWYFRKALDA